MRPDEQKRRSLIRQVWAVYQLAGTGRRRWRPSTDTALKHFSLFFVMFLFWFVFVVFNLHTRFDDIYHSLFAACGKKQNMRQRAKASDVR